MSEQEDEDFAQDTLSQAIERQVSRESGLSS